MSGTILVTGGTGTLGGHVVPLLHAAGVRPRVLSRRPHPDGETCSYAVGDTVTGAGLADALRGIGTVVHLAGGRHDERGAQQVASAAARAGVGHLVLVSVVGADRVPVGYHRAKLATERAFQGAGVPWTVLRATQFHGFVLGTLGRLASWPVVPAPRDVWVEPVDPAAVAERLVAAALGDPQGRAPDVVGPQVLSAHDALSALLDARGRRRRLVAVPVPGAVGRACRERANLAGAGAVRVGGTWAQYLATPGVGRRAR